jgi:pimeloyl-ACP methyl ester carboxylesterase
MNYRINRNLKYWLRLIGVGLIGGLVLSCIIIEGMYVAVMTRPAAAAIGEPPLISEEVTLQPVSLINTTDGTRLSGWYLPSRNGAAVILLHGYGSNRLEMLDRAEVLARHGYGVLLYDLRGHGESQQLKRAFGWEDVGDVGTALQFLSEQPDVDPERIGILGFSVGGQIALRAAAEYGQIQAVIADDPGFVTAADAPSPGDFTQRLLSWVSILDSRLISIWTGIPIPAGIPDALEKIPPRPVLFIATGQGHGRDLVRHFYQLAGNPKQYWEIPETTHGGQFKARPEEYEKRMIEFFGSALQD